MEAYERSSTRDETEAAEAAPSDPNMSAKRKASVKQAPSLNPLIERSRTFCLQERVKSSPKRLWKGARRTERRAEP
eukprot:scaffold130170_cov26-Tisochrysis_lutea.AAC.3